MSKIPFENGIQYWLCYCTSESRTLTRRFVLHRIVRSLIHSGSRMRSSSPLYTATINCDSSNTSVPIALG